MSCITSQLLVRLVSVLGLLAVINGAAFDVFDYVDPLIGTINGGHVFPGATLPFGMAKAGADIKSSKQAQGGFASDNSDILGFSHMHDSGTGGSSSLGNFPIFPQIGCAGDNITDCFFFKDERSIPRLNGSIEAHPGYFAITLNSSIRTEMTVTNHTALYRFTFPSNTSANRNRSLPYFPLILVGLDDLQNSRTDGLVEVDTTTGRLAGNASFYPSFGTGSYNLSFCIDFSGAELRKAGVFTDYGPQDLSQPGVNDNIPPGVTPAGAWAQFFPPTNNQIFVRVGISFMSITQACQNAESEIPSFNFETIRSAAEDAWREKLSVIEVDATGVSDEMQTLFWSGVYRSMISPQDYTGENPLWNSNEPYYDSYYCIWDTFRSTHPLLTLIDPLSQTHMVRSLIDIYRFEGKLPDCRMSLCKGFTQGGSNADIVLADAFLKNITEGVDWATAYQAVLSDAEIQPVHWTVEGRGGLDFWKTIGYIPTDEQDPSGVALLTRSISRTVEYAYDDFCISLMAETLGDLNSTQKYLKRSQNWKNLFNPNQTSPVITSNFAGFLQPRYQNGTFGYQDPALCSPLYNSSDCTLNHDGHDTYEGSSWLYTFFVPQDMASLIHTLGGPASFVARLSYLHTSGLLYVGDEQAFLPIFQFHYAGRPGLSAYFSHYYIPSAFNATIGGIAGNDDSGAMGSFTSLAMMGLWPVAGQDVYLITPPYFPEVKVRNKQSGNTATIRCEGFDSGYKNIYIQSAKLDGEVWEKNWLTHSFWLEGGTLDLVLGSKESKWGTREEDLPPSSSTTG